MRKLLTILSLLILSPGKQTEKTTNEIPSFANLELQKHSLSELQNDFDLLVNSLKEAHTGLYWYSSERQFDSLVSVQRTLLKDSLNGLQFYTIVSPIVAFSKEDHCDISLSDDLSKTQKKKIQSLSKIRRREKQKPINYNLFRTKI